MEKILKPTGSDSTSTSNVHKCAAALNRLNLEPVTEEEIRAYFLEKGSVISHDIAAKFKPRLKSAEDKTAFASILRKISKPQHTPRGVFFCLRTYE